MVRLELLVSNELGFHARAAGKFVQAAAGFDSEIWIVKGSNRVNGKSIMGILTLAAAKGAKIAIEAEGPDEEQALTVLGKLVADGFGERKSGDKGE